jgi:hypothetical protein
VFPEIQKHGDVRKTGILTSIDYDWLFLKRVRDEKNVFYSGVCPVGGILVE